MTRRTLYITFDGALQPLGFSQVVRIVAGLSERGLPYTLLSAEHGRDLARHDHVAFVESLLRSAGVSWVRVRADLEHAAGRSASAAARMLRAAIKIAREDRIDLIHARGYQSAAIAHAMRSLFSIPYVFDARGCWIEERSGPGDWFSNPAPYAVAKFVEQKLYASASAVVTLTELHATDIRASSGKRARLIEVIPTCADYDGFALRDSRPAKPVADTLIPDSIRRALEGKTTLAIIGSLNRSYMAEESVLLAKRAVEASPMVRLVVLSKQVNEYRALLVRANFPMDRALLTSCSHDQMPSWLQWIDWGLLLLPDTASKRGSMPTKLAEFFASGVRPLAHGCNAEMTAWVRRAGSGCIVDTLDEKSIRAAAAIVAGRAPSPEELRKAREISAPHFGLRAGLARYENVVRTLLSASATG